MSIVALMTIICGVFLAIGPRKRCLRACMLALPVGATMLWIMDAGPSPHVSKHASTLHFNHSQFPADDIPPIHSVILDGHSIPVVDEIESHSRKGRAVVVTQIVADDPWGYDEDENQSSHCEDCDEDCDDCEDEPAADKWVVETKADQRPNPKVVATELKKKKIEEQLLVVEDGDKPEWIYETVDYSGNTHRMTVQIGPYESDHIVRHKTEQEVRNAIDKYAQRYLESMGRPVSAAAPVRMNLSLNRIRECIVDRFDDVHQSPTTPEMDPMPVTYRLLEFDEDFRNQVIERYWNQSLAVDRSVRAGVLSGGVLGVLAVVLGFLKLDSATAGSHRRKLAAAATGILGMGILGLVAVMSYLLGW